MPKYEINTSPPSREESNGQGENIDPVPSSETSQKPIPSTRSSVPSSADVVIIGGGIAGTALAYLLSKTRSFNDIVLLERSEIGSGSTRYSAACFRQQFTRVFNVQVNQLSEKYYRGEIARILGYDPLKSVGYLFLKKTSDSFIKAKKQAASQAGWNVQVEAFSPDEVKERFPFIDTRKIAGAIFGARDGFIKSPETIANCLAEAFVDNGGQVFQRVEVDKIGVKNNKVRFVQTNRGTIETKVVVNCAGAWSQNLAATAGSRLPVQPVPRQLTLMGQHPNIPSESMPMTITPDDAYVRPEGQVLLAGYAFPDTVPSFDVKYDYELGLRTVEKLAEYIPDLTEVEIRTNGVCGLYEVTPDHNALIGYDYRIKGLLHCCGFSGHGIMQAPGAAHLIVELLEKGRVESLHPLIYEPLRADRFERQGIVSFPEENVI